MVDRRRRCTRVRREKGRRPKERGDGCLPRGVLQVTRRDRRRSRRHGDKRRPLSRSDVRERAGGEMTDEAGGRYCTRAPFSYEATDRPRLSRRWSRREDTRRHDGKRFPGNGRRGWDLSSQLCPTHRPPDAGITNDGPFLPGTGRRALKWRQGDRAEPRRLQERPSSAAPARPDLQFVRSRFVPRPGPRHVRMLRSLLQLNRGLDDEEKANTSSLPFLLALLPTRRTGRRHVGVC